MDDNNVHSTSQLIRFCGACGSEIRGNNAFCTVCGAKYTDQPSSGVQSPPYTSTSSYNAMPQYNSTPEYNRPGAVPDAPNIGFAILGFFIPLVGLILFLVWHDTLPLRAKSAGKGALIGVIVWVALVLIITIASISMLNSFSRYYWY